MEKIRKLTIKDMAMIGVFTALVFVFNQFSFPIPTMIDSTRIHLGNVMCLLAGVVLGPIGGGFAAGLGGMFYDFTNPLYVNEAWITFILKFAMAWLCGKIAWGGKSGSQEDRLGKRFGRNTVAAVSGALFYVILYMGKNFLQNYFFLRMELTPVLITVGQKGLVSLINGVIAVIIALPLSTALQAALRRAHLLQGPGANTGTASQQQQ